MPIPIPNRAEDAETILYFLPHIRNVLFGGGTGDTSDLDRQGIRPLERYELKRRDLYITIDAGGPVSLSATPVRLFRFPNNGIYFLSFEVMFNEVQPIDWKKLKTPLDLLMALKEKEKREAIQQVQAHRCLAVNNLVRIVYPSFREQVEEDKIAKISLFSEKDKIPLAELSPLKPSRILKGLRPQLSPIINCLVREMLDAGEMQIFPLMDDRMFVISHMALWGEKPVTKAGKRTYKALFSRALYVDQGNDLYPGEYIYDEPYIRQRFEKEVLRIWEGPYGNIYGFTDFSNVYVGFGGFFGDIVSRHIHSIYFYMALMAVYYRVSLTAYTAQLARETGRLLDKPRKSRSRQRIREIRDSFTRFTNQYWFREVSSQMQGIEIFAYQNRSLHMEAEYNGFKEELERADALIQVRWQDKIAFIGTLLTAILAIAGLSDKSIYLQISVGFLLIVIMLYVYPSPDSSKKKPLI